MTTGRRIAVLLAAALAIVAYWVAVGSYALALRYCHIVNCAAGASARAARANEVLAIGGTLFVLIVAAVLLVVVRRARRRPRS